VPREQYLLELAGAGSWCAKDPKLDRL